MLIDDTKDTTGIKVTAERILKILERPFIIDDHEIFVTVSIGIAQNTPKYNTADLTIAVNFSAIQLQSPHFIKNFHS